MKTIVYGGIEITNFKGIKALTVALNSDQTNIAGRNESGKTTFSDAWHWLLTGKNSLDEKEFDIKNTVDRTLNSANHSVTGYIYIDGEEYKLQRILRENWVRPQGQQERVLKGNVQEFFINEVPFQATEYSAEIKKILVDEEKLKMLTNPYYFNRLKWQTQREILNEMAGNPNDAVISALKPEFADLMQQLKGKTIEGYKGEIKGKKKLAADKLAGIPGRLDEVKLGMPELLDFADIEKQIEAKNAELAKLDGQINDRSTAYNEANQVIVTRTQQINRLQNDIIGLKNELKQAEQTKINNAALERQKLKNAVLGVENDIQSKNNLIKSTETKIEGLKLKKADILTEWKTENATKLPEMTEADCSCPTCLQALPPENIAATKKKLIENFNNKKVEKLTKIEKRGNELKAEIIKEEQFIAGIKNQLAPLNTQLAEAKANIEAYIEPAKESVLTEVELCKDPRISEKMNQVDELQALQPVGDDLPVLKIDDIQAQKNTIIAEIDGLKAKLQNKELRKKAETRISELEADQKATSQIIFDLEAIEFLIADFIKTKVEYVEKLIKGLFETVTFKMYDYTLDGNPVDTCQAMFKGVPYSAVNTAGKIQAGLDIIKALSRHLNIQAPIILDNRESITEIPPMPNQVINLFVNEAYDQLTVI